MISFINSMTSRIGLLLLVILQSGCAHSAETSSTLDQQTARDQEFLGKVFCGYQGWFGAEGDGAGAGFDNYWYDKVFKPGTCVIDYWPDMSEADDDEKYPTPFNNEDGSVASVFSAANPKTVDRHFQWMNEYDIDGIFLQRFCWTLKPVTDKRHPVAIHHRNQVLENVLAAARNHNRLWAPMYDLSGIGSGDIDKYLLSDFKRLVDEVKINEGNQRILHQGKPLVAVWGIGFNDGRQYSLDECQKLVDFLKNDPTYGGNAVMLGVPYYWRTQTADTVKDPAFHELLKSADIVSPWSVGRYRDLNQVEGSVLETISADATWCHENGVEYLPVAFPGFSWQNLMIARGSEYEHAFIPRQGGQFLWHQAVAARNGGAKSLYLAMFDEMNEGTCLFKCTNEPPVGESKFQTYSDEGVKEDHYLWLSGMIGRIFSGDLTATYEMPRRPAGP